MFCNQCQETAKNTGCTIKGVCGKTEETSNIQDLLMFACQGLSYLTIEARKQGIDTNAESKHITNCLFMTITNANFDDKSIIQAIKDAIKYRDELKSNQEDRDAIQEHAHGDEQHDEQRQHTVFAQARVHDGLGHRIDHAKRGQ